MKMDLYRNKNIWSGMMWVGVGSAAIFIARDYEFGSARHMGPGFFPSILGAILIAFGICIIAAGLRNTEQVKHRVSLRAVVMLPLSLVLFGVLIENAGFIPAIVVTAFVSAAANKEFRIVEALLLSLLLTAASIMLFIWGIGLPYPLVNSFDF